MAQEESAFEAIRVDDIASGPEYRDTEGFTFAHTARTTLKQILVVRQLGESEAGGLRSA